MPRINKLPTRFLKAWAIRVKRTPATNVRKGYGVPLRCVYNDRAWAGEVADVYTHRATGRDWAQLELIAEFGPGRTLVLGELVRLHDQGPTDDMINGVWRVSLGLPIDLLSVVRS